MIYLEPRHSLVAVNPAILYPKADYKSLDEKLAFVTKYIYGFLEFKKIVDEYIFLIKFAKENNLLIINFN